jgi:hypothetical protein
VFRYRVYGLSVHSALALPGLVKGRAAPEVEVRLGNLSARPPAAREQSCHFQASGAEAYLYWNDVGAIRVRGGREILVDLLPEAVNSEVRLALLGPVMAVVLHQRGRTPLHASGVAVGGGAAVFMGDPGLGKSTTAAAFYSRGHPLLADDLIALNFDPSGRAFVSPGFPRLRLSQEAAALLGWKPESITDSFPAEDKFTYPAERDFPQQPLPLRAIYVLARGKKLAVKPLGQRAALLQLIKHTYRITLMHPIKGSANFLNCAEVVKRVPVRSLRIPRGLSILPNLAEAMEHDLAGLGSWKAAEGASAAHSP